MLVGVGSRLGNDGDTVGVVETVRGERGPRLVEVG